MRTACLVIAVALILPLTMGNTKEILGSHESMRSSIVQKTDSRPSVSTVFAVLTKSVELKSATVGQELILRTLSDVAFKGEVLIPRGAQILGHVQSTRIKGKDDPQSLMAVVVDKAVRADGSEIAVQAIIVAVAAPSDSSLTSDPSYGMMHSNEPKMVGSPTATNTATLPPNSRVGSTAAVATADLKGRMEEPLLLDEKSNGAVGYEGLSILWQLTTPPPVTVFASKGKNLKLNAGTQVLLRMATPQSPR